MPSSELSTIQSLKISLLCRGISISPSAESVLTHNGTIPLSVHEYPTTGGLTLVLEDNVYVNSPFDEPSTNSPEATLLYNAKEEVSFSVLFHGEEFPTRVLPLPGYLLTKDSQGRPVTEAVFSHADRARLSPIGGCYNHCGFCDSPSKQYELRPVEQLLEALIIAQADTILPVNHAVISGGAPGSDDYDYFSTVCEKIIRNAKMPVDVMMAPRLDTRLIDQLFNWGAYGFAINLELYDDELAKYITPQKRGLGLKKFRETIERAVQCTGGCGRVRSLLLIGIEPEEQTLQGVEFLAKLGCDPILSPFRPTPNTLLANEPAPSYDLLESVYLKSVEIVEKHGVKLGPRCIPCMHNTLTFTDQSGAYYFSQESQLLK